MSAVIIGVFILSLTNALIPNVESPVFFHPAGSLLVIDHFKDNMKECNDALQNQEFVKHLQPYLDSLNKIVHEEHPALGKLMFDVRCLDKDIAESSYV